MKVLYFAEIKDILQKAQEDIVLEQALTVQHLKIYCLNVIRKSIIKSFKLL